MKVIRGKARCRGGKSCGATCISRSKVCWKDTPGSLSRSLRSARRAISRPSGGTTYARLSAGDFDGDFKTKPITERFGDRGYNWANSIGSGSKVLGEGEYGNVMEERGANRVVKRGQIGESEVKIANLLSAKDLGPQVIAAELDGAGTDPGFKVGRIAMAKVPGIPLEDALAPNQEINGVKVVDSFWRARASVHKMGIAHNDMHDGNFIVDSKGKGRFVDLGLSQNFPKAALAEALGLFGDKGEGDWQVRSWENTGGSLMRTAFGPGKTPAGMGDLRKRAPPHG